MQVKNPIVKIENGVVFMHPTNSREVIFKIDETDLAAVSPHPWRLTKISSGVTQINTQIPEDRPGRTGKWRSITLHRFLIPEGIRLNPKDGSYLNCRRSNFEISYAKSAVIKCESGVAHLALSHGYILEVDEADLPLVSRYKWSPTKNGRNVYAHANVPDTRPNAKRKWMSIQIHRLLMSPGDSGIYIDHIDHNGLNNTRENLRLATPQQNAMHRRANNGAFSAYKGVTYHTKNRCWQAQIFVGRKVVWRDYFRTEIEAAIAYNKAAPMYHGEYAELNVFPWITTAS